MFASREDAGRRLGLRLKTERLQADLVLGLPRGGVVVAAEVACVLQLPLDVLIVRKIGHPWQREFAVGALAEHGVIVLDEAALGHDSVLLAEFGEIVKEEKGRLRDYQASFHIHGALELGAKSLLLVDDGLATGATTEAAILSVKRQGARRVAVAVPVASASAVERIQPLVDEVIALCVDPDFDAVGRYYEIFSQITDEEVLKLLGRK